MVGCLILASIPTALCRTTAPIVYVAGDSSGDFNCVGTDDHVQINQALKFVADNSEYTTVHLKGPFTYVINDTLLIGSNTILEGDSTAVIKLANNAGWPTMKPLIKQMSSSGNNNIVIRGFEVNVNHDSNTELKKGLGYYNVIYFLYCKNVTICDMYMHDGHGDGMRIKSSEDIQFYNNTIYKLGHDGLYAIQCQNVEAWNNTITCRTNSGLRIWNSNHVKFHDNVIDSFYDWSAGGPGIQIEKGGPGAGLMDDIEIYNNTINNTYGPGIWLYNYDTSSDTRDMGKNVHIHHNIFYSTGTNPNIVWVGGIVAGGFDDTLIENNVFDGAYNAAVVHMYHPSYSSSYSPPGGYITTLRNNIIINTRKCTKDSNGGYGTFNYLSSTHTFVLENNCLYNNSAGNYKNCTSKSDLYVNPLFADPKNHDYHLQSVSGRCNGETWIKDKVSSPCIDTGYSLSDYSNEPEDNGNRINIGRYGNTVYASLSGIHVVNHAPVMDPISEIAVKAGENLNILVKASDADGDNLTYSASNLPAGASFDKSGFFSWTPANGQIGLYTVSFEVSDGKLNDSKIAILKVVKEEVPLNLSGKMYDNRLREASPEDIFSNKSFLDVGGMTNVGGFRDLIWFNVSEYTSVNEINNATLSLFWYYPSSSRPNDTVIEVYRPVAWNPDYVSWNKRNKDIAWNNEGGDWYDSTGVLQGSTPYATLTLKASSLPDNRYCELNVTDLV
ncbi:disaggregatase related repeat-containing protein, partial [Methanosarcina sp.]|uniref:disaggregatase related repeat-containing protein n=1 Tax=Methanosarcina sp. TaxID=2213 RepID=UPI003C78B73A